MQIWMKVVACCLFLPGCVEKPPEITTTTVNFSKPLAVGKFFIECGPLDGIVMYPVPLPRKYTVDGTYTFSSSRSDLTIDEGVGSERRIVSIPDERDTGVNANFFVHGLKDGCTGVFGATRVDIMRTEAALASGMERGITLSPVVDGAYFAFQNDPKEKADFDQNALFIDVSGWSRPKIGGGTTFLFFEGAAFGNGVVPYSE
jgi:hypothetical protein